jgi:endonuclease YncB( thermonuclease family)
LLLAVALGSAVGAMAAIGLRHALSTVMPSARLEGATRVVDGDSLVIGGVSVRLKGIDAPEIRQSCRRSGMDWRCGQEAADRLRAIVESATLQCRRIGEDRNGRTLARCRADGEPDIAARLVREGWAVSYDTSYLAEEREARDAGRGIWASEFERPRVWRRAQRAVMEE